MSAPRHADRQLAVSSHAVERLRERANAHYMDDERVRLLIAEAVGQGVAEAHYVRGQERVLVSVLGCDVYAVIGKDKTGWGRGRGRRAVVTVLTLEQVRSSEGSRNDDD